MNPASNPITVNPHWHPILPLSLPWFTLYFDDKTIILPSETPDGTTDFFHVSSHEVIMEANRFFWGN